MQPRIALTVLRIHQFRVVFECELDLEIVGCFYGIDETLGFLGYLRAFESFQLALAEFAQLGEVGLHLGDVLFYYGVGWGAG